MLITMLVNQPQILGAVLKGTPTWVWGLLAGLTWLGWSQTRARTASLGRIMLTPVIMTALSGWGVVSAFGQAPQFGYVLAAWIVTAAAVTATIAFMAPAAGTLYEPASRIFTTRGSWIPMQLILGIFLTKYVVGIDMAMQPGLAQDSQYVLVVAVLYGAFTGIFAGRAARLWRLAFRPAAARAEPTPTLQRDPW